VIAGRSKPAGRHLPGPLFGPRKGMLGLQKSNSPVAAMPELEPELLKPPEIS
jgi:hypothetical protein